MRSWRTGAAGKETAGTRFLEQQGSWHDRGRARRPAFWRGQKGEGERRERDLPLLLRAPIPLQRSGLHDLLSP